MKNSKTILVAYDLSIASRNALEIAAELAARTNSALFIYHVISASVLTDSEMVYTFSPEEDAKKMNALIKRGVTYLKKRFPGVPVNYKIDYGFLIPSIIDKTKEINPWLSVFGVKKRTGLDKVIFGDTCSTLIGQLRGGMLVIPMNYRKLDLRLIAYAWDGLTSEVYHLGALRTMLNTGKSKIMAINITHYDEKAEKNTQSFKQNLKRMFVGHTVEVSQTQGLDKEKELERVIRKIEPKMTVVFAHHYPTWQKIFHKRFSRKIFKFIKSPMLVVSEKN